MALLNAILVLLTLWSVVACESDFRIIRGDVAKEGQFPSIVAITKGQKMHCTGSLITPNIVLTAAHCLCKMSRMELNQLRVFAGVVNLIPISTATQQKSARAVRVGIHPSYRKFCWKQAVAGFDVALLKVAPAFKLSQKVNVGQLRANSTAETVENVTIAGYGKDERNQSGTLNFGSLDGLQTCPREDAITMKNAICFDCGNNSQVISSGDCGSPMYADDMSILGVASGAIGLNGTFYGVYSSVSNNLAYIRHAIRILGR